MKVLNSTILYKKGINAGEQDIKGKNKYDLNYTKSTGSVSNKILLKSLMQNVLPVS